MTHMNQIRHFFLQNFGSFCDFLKAIKKTNEVTPETPLHLLEFYPDKHVLITMTDIVLSYTRNFQEKKD